MATVKSALVVEDEEQLAATLGVFAAAHAEVVHVVTGKRAAEERLRTTEVEAALIDLTLPDGSGLDLLPMLWRQPVMPRVIVISGAATPAAAFALAQAGVRTFVEKPIALAELERAWEQTIKGIPDLRPLVRASVGMVSLCDVEDQIRRSMAQEALARARDSRRGASRLLGVSREVLQHILGKHRAHGAAQTAPGRPRRPPKSGADALLPTLTARERDVLTLLATGATYAEIGSELGIGTNTVRSHIRSLYDKCGVQNGTEAVSLAWSLGLLDDRP